MGKGRSLTACVPSWACSQIEWDSPGCVYYLQVQFQSPNASSGYSSVQSTGVYLLLSPDSSHFTQRLLVGKGPETKFLSQRWRSKHSLQNAFHFILIVLYRRRAFQDGHHLSDALHCLLFLHISELLLNFITKSNFVILCSKLKQ